MSKAQTYMLASLLLDGNIANADFGLVTAVYHDDTKNTKNGKKRQLAGSWR